MSLREALKTPPPIKVTGFSMTETTHQKLVVLSEHYDVKRSPLVAALIDAEYAKLVKARKIKNTVKD